MAITDVKPDHSGDRAIEDDSCALIIHPNSKPDDLHLSVVLPKGQTLEGYNGKIPPHVALVLEILRAFSESMDRG